MALVGNVHGPSIAGGLVAAKRSSAMGKTHRRELHLHLANCSWLPLLIGTAGDIGGGAGAANDIGLAVEANEGGVKVVSLGEGRKDPPDMEVGRAGGGGGTAAAT